MHFIHLDTYFIQKIHFKKNKQNMKQQKNNSHCSDAHLYVNV